MSLKDNALKYHSEGRAGKIEVMPTKQCKTQGDLSLAYSPGVAYACLAIKDDPSTVFKYTAKGNLVAVISNGTAVLGLGNIGPMGAKPVMEGKGVLFKRFADIDVFDIELASKTPEEVIAVCKALEPTFGGINLEDIKAPDCFVIEQTLQSMNIPVFHDDQHGTAIIVGAGILSAVEIVKKDMKKVKIVINGAGAAGISCAKHLARLGADKNNIILCDTKGPIYKGRKEGMNEYKEEMAVDTPARTLAEAAKGADILMGLSSKGAFTQDMVKSMAKDPIIFAMANPDPEITPDDVAAVRSDAIVGTGRSDYNNQVNNVLCFPFIFRGALDVKAKCINDEMKVAASRALAALAKEPITDEVRAAYDGADFTFGRDYVIPKPFDERVFLRVSMAVAKAAMDTGVALEPIKDFAEYENVLRARMSRLHKKILAQ